MRSVSQVNEVTSKIISEDAIEEEIRRIKETQLITEQRRAKELLDIYYEKMYSKAIPVSRNDEAGCDMVHTAWIVDKYIKASKNLAAIMELEEIDSVIQKEHSELSLQVLSYLSYLKRTNPNYNNQLVQMYLNEKNLGQVTSDVQYYESKMTSLYNKMKMLIPQMTWLPWREYQSQLAIKFKKHPLLDKDNVMIFEFLINEFNFEDCLGSPLKTYSLESMDCSELLSGIRFVNGAISDGNKVIPCILSQKSIAILSDSNEPTFFVRIEAKSTLPEVVKHKLYMSSIKAEKKDKPLTEEDVQASMAALEIILNHHNYAI